MENMIASLITGTRGLDESLEVACAKQLSKVTGLVTHGLQFRIIVSGTDTCKQNASSSEDEIYDIVAVFETEAVGSYDSINGDGVREYQFFPFNEPLPPLDSLTESVLQALGQARQN